MVYIIFSFITIFVISIIVNCHKKNRSSRKSEAGKHKNEVTAVEEDPFAILKANLANQERKTQSDSLKDCSVKNEKNPLYNKSRETASQSAVSKMGGVSKNGGKQNDSKKQSLKKSGKGIQVEPTQQDDVVKNNNGRSVIRNSTLKVDPTQNSKM
ncbi:unnamed protein product [Caenorhabditis angaria]|uniref:Uncharacterized protein n=1 Tax=Caenorhabditis angaria TaxID=860376 RepID=A0A9P1MWM2_9PELO|nr:unnamed protein product [Caenorhabditis angaria]